MSAISRALAVAKKTPDTRIVLGAAGLAFVIKVILAATSVGTNDVIAWQEFSEYILEHGPVGIYSAIELYNHPPLVSLWLSFIGSIAGDDLRMFAFLMRLPSIVADFGSVFLVWGLSRRYYVDRRALFATVIFALSPVLLLVSGFHGNTDPVFMFLLLATVYVVGVKNEYALGGVLFGLSLSIKIVPVLMVPAFFFWLRSRGELGRFFGSAFAVVALGYSYHLIHVYKGIFGNILSYGGIKNIWGFGKIIPGYETVGRVSSSLLLRVVSGSCFGRREQEIPTRTGWHR
jgi:Gpi18-like mannosyltransferase